MKVSSIIIRLMAPLEVTFTKSEIDTIRRFLFQCVDGVDEVNRKRWRRWWALFFQRTVGQFYPVVDRDLNFHRMHMALMREIHENQDGFMPTEAGFKAFMAFVKTGALFGAFEESAGQLVFVPASRSADDCSDDEMREFHGDALEFLRSPIALKTLFPAMDPIKRIVALESILLSPKEREAMMEKPQRPQPKEQAS